MKEGNLPGAHFPRPSTVTATASTWRCDSSRPRITACRCRDPTLSSRSSFRRRNSWKTPAINQLPFYDRRQPKYIDAYSPRFRPFQTRNDFSSGNIYEHKQWTPACRDKLRRRNGALLIKNRSSFTQHFTKHQLIECCLDVTWKYSTDCWIK